MHKTTMRHAFEAAKVTPATDPALVAQLVRVLKTGTGISRHPRRR